MRSSIAPTLALLIACAVGCSGSSGPRQVPPPPALAQALGGCTQLRMLDLVALSLTVMNEYGSRGDGMFTVNLDVDGDGTTDATLDLDLAHGPGTIGWALGGVLLGGSGSFTVNGRTLTGSGRISSATSNCVLDFDLGAGLSVAMQGVQPVAGDISFSIQAGNDRVDGTATASEGSLNATVHGILHNGSPRAGFTFRLLAAPVPPAPAGSAHWVFAAPSDAATPNSLDVYTMSRDGTNLRNLTNTNNRQDRGPAWSPDGSRIAWLKFEGSIGLTGFFDLYVMDPDGTNEHRVTDFGASPAPGFGGVQGFSWSPAGNEIAITVARVGFLESEFRIVSVPPIPVLTQGQPIAGPGGVLAARNAPLVLPDGSLLWVDSHATGDVYHSGSINPLPLFNALSLSAAPDGTILHAPFFQPPLEPAGLYTRTGPGAPANHLGAFTIREDIDGDGFGNDSVLEETEGFVWSLDGGEIVGWLGVPLPNPAVARLVVLDPATNTGFLIPQEISGLLAMPSLRPGGLDPVVNAAIVAWP